MNSFLKKTLAIAVFIFCLSVVISANLFLVPVLGLWLLAVNLAFFIAGTIFISHLFDLSIPGIRHLLKHEYYRLKFKRSGQEKPGFLSDTYLKFLVYLILMFKSADDSFELIKEEAHEIYSDALIFIDKYRSSQKKVSSLSPEQLNRLLDVHCDKQKRATYFSLSSLIILALGILLISLASQVIFPGLKPLRAVTHGWVQTDWSGGVSSSIADHFEDMENWSLFLQKDSAVDISTEGELSITEPSDSIIESSGSDFEDGEFDNTFLTMDGRVMLQKPYGASCESDEECSGDFQCFDGVCLDFVLIEEVFENTSTGREGEIQTWEVPFTGTYRITAHGAEGGDNSSSRAGRGARMVADIELEEGDEIKLLVGQQGTDGPTSNGDGGGGGSFVVRVVESSPYQDSDGDYVEPLLVAGGGAGGYDNSPPSDHGDGYYSGTESDSGGSATVSYTAAGASFSEDGEGASGAEGGFAFLNGGHGGYATGDSAHGGFGGGGSSNQYNAGGGGGGYQGGDSNYSASSQTTGGGSFVHDQATLVESVDGDNSGHGLVEISNWPLYLEQIEDTKQEGETCEYDVECIGDDIKCVDGICTEVSEWVFENTSTGRSGSIQNWTVPKDGIYRITAYGAQGGAGTRDGIGGLGAKMSGDFELEEGQVIEILVGQEGEGGSSQEIGGGGGSFVVRENASSEDDILIIAGGGGGYAVGSGTTYQQRAHASTDTSGKDGYGGDSWGSGGSNGEGGGAASSRGSGGGGFFTDGDDGSGNDGGGQSFLNGGLGGSGSSVDGGFGGGGATDQSTGWGAASGGGGYSGGGGAYSSSDSNEAAGGGGGSFIHDQATLVESVDGDNSGHGLVEISN